MDFAFENVRRLDTRVVAEVMYRTASIGYWVGIGFYVTVTVYCLWLCAIGFGFTGLAVLLVCGAVYLLLNPYLSARKHMELEKATHRGSYPEVVIRFGEKIQLDCEDLSRTWEYYHLKKVYSLKFCYYLQFMDKSGLYIYRENFTKGTFEEFKQFLREKRPDLRIPE